VRRYRVVPNPAIRVDNRPVAYTTLQPGARVIVRGGQPVAFRQGQYVVISGPAAAAPVVTAPGTTTTVTTVTAPPVVASANGIVAAYDPKANVVVLTDGRMVQLTSKSAILVNG